MNEEKREKRNPIIYEKKKKVSHKYQVRKRKKKEKKRKVGKRKEEKEERKGLREMNSGVNASLRFAFTTIVERGAFYNRKQVRKNQKEFVYQKVSNQRKGVYLSKGCLFIKRVFVLSKVSNQRKGVHEKRKRGERKTKRKPKHVRRKGGM